MEKVTTVEKPSIEADRECAQGGAEDQDVEASNMQMRSEGCSVQLRNVLKTLQQERAELEWRLVFSGYRKRRDIKFEKQFND